MFIRRLLWDDYRIEHIAQHDVDPGEVWEVCEDPLHVAHREGRNRYRLYGQTVDGRYLFVVLERVEASLFRPITARDMTDAEKRNFRRLRIMKRLEVPEFATYEDEAAFWDNLDTADFIEDDGAWFRFETPTKRAVRVAVLPDIAEALAQRARAQGVSVETLVNVLLAESVSKPVVAG